MNHAELKKRLDRIMRELAELRAALEAPVMAETEQPKPGKKPPEPPDR